MCTVKLEMTYSIRNKNNNKKGGNDAVGSVCVLDCRMTTTKGHFGWILPRAGRQKF